MNGMQPGRSQCGEICQHLDSYISSELPPETGQEVLQHLAICSACTAELERRKRFRAQLKAAVGRQYVPRDLQARIRERIESRGSRFGWTAGWNRFAVAMAATVAICLGLWVYSSRIRMPALSDRPGQAAYIQKVSAALAPILRVGLRDHIHCSIFRKYPQNPPTVTQMANELGPSYAELLQAVKAAVPGEYRIIMAHRCGYAGRKYIHFTLQNGQDLISLVISRKNAGESLHDLAPTLRSAGIPVYQAKAEQYEVAGFDAGPYLAFVVSNLRDKTNLDIAARLAPSVRSLLTNASA